MRISCRSVFIVTLLLGWLFFGWFGDFNMYIVRNDGSRWIKQHATITDRIIGGFIIALIFASLDTALIWAWQRLRLRAHASKLPNDETAG
jgi:hypothetical protein